MLAETPGTRVETINGGIAAAADVTFVTLNGIAPAGALPAPGPSFPVITEVFRDPIGTDGPVGRDPANLHQEFIEIYLPELADLDLSFDKDNVNLTFYEVEGDSTSGGVELVNYRIDLPTFDFDPSNGATGILRPPSGVVVLGWVDYVGNPPTGLAGTPGTRIAMIHGGITAATDFVFVAINGEAFGETTTNFAVPTAMSIINTTTNPTSGKIERGSGVYLLVDRDDPGYALRYDQNDTGFVPPISNAELELPGGLVLQTSALMDAFATNDDADFDVLAQPYASPTGDNLDLETVLPLGGAFSLLVAQVPEDLQGLARLYLDNPKTTEDLDPGNDDPVADALTAYTMISNVGPMGPTPGSVYFTTSPAELEVADARAQIHQVLSNTTGRPGILAANIGGNFGMSALATPGPSPNPAVILVGMGDPDTVITGKTEIFPTVAVTVAAGTPAGTMDDVVIDVDASVGMVGDPAVVNPSGTTVATFVVLDPKVGLDHLGLPMVPVQGTALIAFQGLPDELGVPNEFAQTSLATYIGLNLGAAVVDDRGNGAALIDPTTDLSNPLVVGPMEDEMPTDPLLFINVAGAPGTDDLVTTISTSAEVLSGASTYLESFNLAGTLVQATQRNLIETATMGGIFVPTERVHYANANGLPGRPSGLTGVDTNRGFELALIDTNLRPIGTLETGATDDFGVLVRAARTRVGSPVVPGEWIFLSFMGGREGADVDTLDVPPHGNQTVVVLIDLDNLDTEMAVETIDGIAIVDGSGNGEVNVLEYFSLSVDGVTPVPEPGVCLSMLTGIALLAALARRRRAS